MRNNPVKTKIMAGGSAFGVMVFEFFTPGIAQICKAAGAEFILYDMEHTAVSTETLRQQFAMCRGLGIAPFVRVPATEYDFIARMLDVGAMGIMVPMVDTAEQAAFIAACCKYPPVGRRGAAFGVAHDDFLPGSPLDKMKAGNERTLVICQIETAKGAENCDAIAAVPGVDVLWVGHFDLTNFMGIPTQFQNPRYLAAIDAVVAACAKHGKVPAFMAADQTWMKDYLAKGFRLMAHGVDSAIFQGALAQGIEFMKAETRSLAREAAKAKRAAGRAAKPATKSGPAAKAKPRPKGRR
ncbi:MAG: aldolase [Alphaproteobacteria bacterium]|nr:aldolase [Alphaproteobacteria bacterium]